MTLQCAGVVQHNEGSHTWFKVKNFNPGIRDVGSNLNFAICQFITQTKSFNLSSFQVQWEDYELCSDKPGFKSKVYCILARGLRHIM